MTLKDDALSALGLVYKGAIIQRLGSIGDEMATLIIANKNYSSWSLRPWVLMKMLGMSFVEHLEPFEGADNYDRFRQFSPSGKVPCLIEDGITIWDSLAVVERLAEIDPRVWPESLAARAFARSVACEIHSGFSAVRMACPMICRTQFKFQTALPDVDRDIARLDELIGQGLKTFKGPFLTGAQFTAVDAFLCPMAVRVAGFQLQLSAASLDYCSRLLALEPMQRWIKEAKSEPWVDEQEELVARRNAVVLTPG